MSIRLIAVGKRMPTWVDTAYTDYAKRLPRELSLQLTEIALPTRHKHQPTSKAIAEEGQSMLTLLPTTAYVIALDQRGKMFDTPQLAKQLSEWQALGQPLCLLIGGPDGLAPTCLTRANTLWSLSALTLAHPMVRVIVAEQLYRAWTLQTGHPYHR